jgi:DNA-binding NtrC family response regulator
VPSSLTQVEMSSKPTRDLPDRSDKLEGERSVALLLVERDDGVRRFLFWALYVEGFKVLTGRDAKEGLRLSRDVPGPLQILIIGSLPPGSNGAEMRNQIESERPEVRTILLDDLESSEAAARPQHSRAAQSSGEGSVDAGALIRRIRSMVAR